MKKNLLAIAFLSLASSVHATPICDIRDPGMRGQPSDAQAKSPAARTNFVSGQCGNNAYSKNSEECPQPKSFCVNAVFDSGTSSGTIIGADSPINAEVVCLGVGGGRLTCYVNPTSIDGAFTYHWTFTRYNQVVYSGHNHSMFDIDCSENTSFGVQVVVNDVFGQSETVYTTGMCLVGQEN